MTNAPVFIVGCARSGTSLLRNLLRAHPRLTFPSESHFIPEFYHAYGDPKSSREACRLAERILKLWWVTRWGLSLQAEWFAHYRTFREVVSRIYEEYARRENKMRWGDKTPRHVLCIPTLLEIFPDGQIIHIYRDGRDVALSQFKHPSGVSRNVFVAAEVWKHRVGIGRASGATLSPHQYLEIKYESLIGESEHTMRRVCTFLGEPFSAEVLHPRFLERNTPRNHFGARHPLDVSRNEIIDTNQGKWRQQMSARDRLLFESIAGGLLEELGYETEGRRRDVTAVEKYFWKSHHQLWFLWARLNMETKRRWVPSHLRIRWAIIRRRLRSIGIVA